MNDKIKDYLANYQLKGNRTPVIVKRKRTNINDRKKYGLSANSANYYHNLYNGKESFSLDEIRDANAEKHGFAEIYSCRYTTIRHVVEYVEDLDVVAVLCFRLETGSYEMKPIQDWEYLGGHIIRRDKTCASYYKRTYWGYRQEDPEWIYVPVCKYTYINSYYRFCDVKFKEDIAGVNGESYQDILAPFLKMFPQNCNIGANTRVNITDNPKSLSQFLMFKEPVGKTGPAQKKIDELIAKPLPDVGKLSGPYEKIGVVQNVEENLCVLRTFYRQDTDFVESGRIYFDKKKAYACKIVNDGRFLHMILRTSAKNWEFNLEDFDKEVAKGTILEYYAEIISAIPAELRAVYMWCFASYPIFEKLYKSGFQDVVTYILKNSEGRNPLNQLEDIFGKICKGKNLAAQLGMNKRQMLFVQEYLNRLARNNSQSRYEYNLHHNAFLITRLIFDDDFANVGVYYYSFKPTVSLAALDNETFDFVFEHMQNCDLWSAYYERSYIIHAMNKIRQNYSLQTMKHTFECLDKVVNQQVDVGHYRLSVARVLYDYMEMVFMTDSTHYFKPYFADENELREKHDYLVEIVNTKKTEIFMNGFNKRKEVWDKFVFDDGKSPFIVIRPDAPEDLAREGMELHHCVKSYIQKVAQGQTNIVFIRKRDDKDTPFFTAEVDNNKKIQQVHGSCNRNTPTEPGMPEFVHLWAKKCGLKEETINKVR